MACVILLARPVQHRAQRRHPTCSRRLTLAGCRLHTSSRSTGEVVHATFSGMFVDDLMATC
jgi:hypothetical protein